MGKTCRLQHVRGVTEVHAAELREALQAQLTDIRFPLSQCTECEIRRQVCEYVDELKELGLPPERIILAVKRVANDAGLHSTMLVTGFHRDLYGGEKLLAEMVDWCIHRFYGEAVD